MFKFVLLSLVLSAVFCQEVRPRVYRRPEVYSAPRRVEDRINYIDEAPKPYAFSYDAHADEGVGTSSRTETADGSGRVVGSYSLTNEEGHTRYVDYTADENGFRATIRTNEPGTANQSPADVILESAAPLPYAANVDRAYLRPTVRTVRARTPVAATVEEVEQPIAEQPVVLPLRPLPTYRRASYYGGVSHYH